MATFLTGRWSAEGGESTGSGVTTGGCPGVVPSLAERWSHPRGGTHLKAVPCRWRATTPLLLPTARLPARSWA